MKPEFASSYQKYLAHNATRFRLEDFCFDKQRAFVMDPAPFKTAVCSRRAGKTVGCAAHLIHAARSKANVVCLYITLSRTNAKRLIWNELKKINDGYKLGGKKNESELSITYANGSVIYVAGAHHSTEIEKFRGLPLYLVYIDECQSFRGYIEALVDDIIGPALFDYAGTLCLTGTPGPVPAGYFHKQAVNKKWAHHTWTMFENPWLQKKSGFTAQQLLQRELDRKGVDVNHPSIQRECFARWVIDTDTLVFKYSAAKNHFEGLPGSTKPWQHIIGVDLGHDDADAIAVIAWNEKFPGVYLRAEDIQTKQGITELADKLEKLIEEYDPTQIVMDTGGLGKKIAEEIRKRRQIPIKAAEKSRKFEYIELLNDALRTGRFMAHQESAFAQDCNLVEWDRDPETLKRNPEKPEISDKYHSDICDAVLYAYRESLHWLHEPEPAIILPGSPEFYKREESFMEQHAVEFLRQQGNQDPEPLGDPWDGWG